MLREVVGERMTKIFNFIPIRWISTSLKRVVPRTLQIGMLLCCTLKPHAQNSGAGSCSPLTFPPAPDIHTEWEGASYVSE